MKKLMQVASSFGQCPDHNQVAAIAARARICESRRLYGSLTKVEMTCHSYYKKRMLLHLLLKPAGVLNPLQHAALAGKDEL